MHRLICLVFLLALACLPAGAQRVPLPSQPENTPWPTDAWNTAPLDLGTNTAAIDTLIDTAFERTETDDLGETRALVIIWRGQIVRERYREGFNRDTRFVSFSIAKSLTHALVGRAHQMGLIEDVAAPMPVRWAWPEDADQPNWLHWLSMTAGLEWAELNVALADDDATQLFVGDNRYDVLGYLAGKPVLEAPGEAFAYSSGGYHAVSWALQRAVADEGCTLSDWHPRDGSVGENCTPVELVFDTWAKQALFYPTGMSPILEFDDSGTFLGGSSVYATARDYARLGLLYLRDGVWEGERLLPEGWVDLARRPGPVAEINTYGSGFWITPPAGRRAEPPGYAAEIGPRDAFSAQGYQGQTIWIVPSRDLVIVRLGRMENSRKNWLLLMGWNQSIASLFPEVERR